MATVLVVDDFPVDRQRAGALLEKRSGQTAIGEHTGIKAVYAAHGREALASMQQSLPDLVLTDLMMPEMNGLELVEQVRRHHPMVPVVLMTAHGSEEIAVQALQQGAASYVPKRELAQNLLETVENILSLSQAAREQQHVLQYLDRWESQFHLPNDLSLIAPVVGYLQNDVERRKLWDEVSYLRVTVALREALVNAMEHGNMEIASELRQSNEKAYHLLFQERVQQSPYRDRQVHVTAIHTATEARYVIRDEGPGFNSKVRPDPTDPANLQKVGGRGLLLIWTFMEEAYHNVSGNEITMVKRRDRDRTTKEEVGQSRHASMPPGR